MAKLNDGLIHTVAELLRSIEKSAFVPTGPTPAPAAPPTGAPMDPSAAGGMPPLPAGPSAGGMPPMDPAMMGGMPPMDPAAMGGMPPDPAMMGGMPPMPPEAASSGAQPIMVTLDDLMALFSQIKGGGSNEATPDLSKALDKISERLDAIETQLGGGGGAPPMPPAGEMGAMPNLDELTSSVAPIGAPMTPMPEATAAPMPMMPAAGRAGDGQVKFGKASAIGALVARLRR